MILKLLAVTLLSVLLLNLNATKHPTKQPTKPTQKWNEANYNQDDYDMTIDIAELIEYNHSYLKDPKLAAVPITRTTRAFNGSMYLLQNLTKDIRLEFQVYKFLSNEYRYFPLGVTVNLCDEYERNLFNSQQIVHNVTNIRSCPPLAGYYYAKNATPEYSKLPPFIPRGSFKSVSKFYHKSDLIAKVEVRGRILDKPIKWWTL